MVELLFKVYATGAVYYDLKVRCQFLSLGWCNTEVVPQNVHRQRLYLLLHNLLEASDAKLLLQLVKDLGLHDLLLEALEL